MLRQKLKELTANRQFELFHAMFSGVCLGLTIGFIVGKFWWLCIASFVVGALWALPFGYYLNVLACEYKREKRAQATS